jgi:Protein of unknown function (DUF2950)
MKREMIHIVNLWLQKLLGRARSTMVPLALLAMWATTGAFPSLAQQTAQPAFPSAADATQSLFRSVQSNNEQAIANILGGPTDLTSSRDPGQDKVDRELFVQKYQEMHRLGREADGSVTLYLGAENWPFPIPLVKKDGAWRFDSDAGLKEVLYRRVGENELTAIAICHDFVAAARHDRAKPNTANPEDGPAARLVASAARDSGGGEPLLFHGYYFRELPTRGVRAGAGGKTTDAFALIAYPAEYRSSGVMTFIVTDKDVVYEKDLGANTSALARAMAAFHKDATWRPTDE